MNDQPTCFGTPCKTQIISSPKLSNNPDLKLQVSDSLGLAVTLFLHFSLAKPMFKFSFDVYLD